jgi:hypothetical protein
MFYGTAYIEKCSDELQAGQPEFVFRQGKIFLFTVSRPALRPTQPPIQWVQGALSRKVKQQGHEVDHLPPSGAEVKNGAIPPLPHTSSWCGA